MATPFLANTMGWIFTEMGRQPWVVFGVLQTSQSVSAGVAAGTVVTSLVVFTLLYGGLARWRLADAPGHQGRAAARGTGQPRGRRRNRRARARLHLLTSVETGD